MNDHPVAHRRLTARHKLGQTLDLDKAPGMAETIDWVSALSELGATELASDDLVRSIGTIAKTPDDRDLIGAAFASAERTP